MRCVDDSFITCRLNPKEGALHQLNCQVFAKTGIPPNTQQFIAGTKLVTSSADIKDNSTLTLKIKLCGGSNCDICYSSGSLFICKECKQTLCVECSGRVHQHPKRAHHKPDRLYVGAPDDASLDTSNTDTHDSVENFEIVLSQDSERSLSDAMLIATLAEQFGLTSFKTFQKEVIDATLQCKDTLVIQPTGSGKSLCFQFPPVHQNKKAIIVTPTISLMQEGFSASRERNTSGVSRFCSIG